MSLVQPSAMRDALMHRQFPVCRTCRWHVRNYGTDEEPKFVTLCNACKINFDQVSGGR